MEFNELNLSELDKDLTPEERAEWQAIYASYRSGSVIRGEAAGVDYHEFEFIPEGKKRPVNQSYHSRIRDVSYFCAGGRICIAFNVRCKARLCSYAYRPRK